MLRLIRYWAIVAILVPCGADIAVGLSDEDKRVVNEELARLKSADPEVDVQVAMRKGDYRFVGLMGYALEVPGINQREFQEKYRDQYGVKTIEGTSDYLETPEIGELWLLGRRYAERYNRLLLEEIEVDNE